MTISLGCRLPGTSSDLPGGYRDRRRLAAPASRARRTASSLLFGLSPGGVCRAPTLPPGPVRSYRTFSPLPPPGEPEKGGVLSVALSLRRQSPIGAAGVARHRVLRRSDFPRSRTSRNRGHPADRGRISQRTMTNDEARMTNQTAMTNDEKAASSPLSLWERVRVRGQAQGLPNSPSP